MNSFDGSDWTESERELLASLRDQYPDLPAHEDDTVRALRRHRLLAGRPSVVHVPSWLRPLQFAGVAAAVTLAFIAGTQYQKQRDPVVERVLVPVRQEQPYRTAVAAANYDLMDESYSPANSHPKDRMSRSRSRDR